MWTTLCYVCLLPCVLAFLTPMGALQNARHRESMLMTWQTPNSLDESSQPRSTFLAQATAAALGAVALSSVPQEGTAIGQLYEYKSQERFVQHAVVNVPDMEQTLRFLCEGLEMQVLGTRRDAQAGTNTTFVGYGPEALRVPDSFLPGVTSFRSYGGHVSLELVAKDSSAGDGDLPYYDPGNGLQYIQMAVENYRISKVLDAGGNILYGYGYLLVEAPGGLRLNVFMGERRDPPMFVALKVKDLKRSIQWYKEALGMTQFDYPKVRPAANSPFEPQQPKGSVFLAYNPEAMGVLLIPAARGETVRVGSVYSKLALLAEGVEAVGNKIGASYVGKAPGTDTRVAVTTDPDGYGVVLVEYEDWDKEVRA